VFNTLEGITGQMAFTHHTAEYGKGGYTWPWDNYFAVRQFPLQEKDQPIPAAQELVSFYKVTVQRPGYIVQPLFSPDGTMLAFKVGAYSSSFDRFTLHIYNINTHTLETIDAPYNSIYFWRALWSPDSRYLLYYRGGFRFPTPGETPPLELWAYDRQAKKSIFIARNAGLLGNVAWTAKNTILYSLTLDNSANGEAPIRADVLSPLYEYNFTTKQSTKVLEDAIRPTPSPDGKWIIAFGKRLIEEKTVGQQAKRWTSNRYLTLFSRQGEKPNVIREEVAPTIERTFLRWSPDSNICYRLTTLFKGINELQTSVSAIAVNTKQINPVCSFSFGNAGKRAQDELIPIFLPLRVSHDGRYLFFWLVQEDGANRQGLTLYDCYIKSIDIFKREVITIARVRENGGVDWLDRK
jgi:WD40 repeat protein